MNQQGNTTKPSILRFIGKVKSRICNGATGQFQKFAIWIDNPSAVNADGTPNTFHKGTLLWLDAETGKKYIVKQIELAGVGEASAKQGFVNSLKLDLADSYHVDDLG